MQEALRLVQVAAVAPHGGKIHQRLGKIRPQRKRLCECRLRVVDARSDGQRIAVVGVVFGHSGIERDRLLEKRQRIVRPVELGRQQP